METMSLNEIEKIAKCHHTAWAKGYVSRKVKTLVEEYEGKFGRGYKVHRPCWQSSTYHYVTYYIFK